MPLHGLPIVVDLTLPSKKVFLLNYLLISVDLILYLKAVFLNRIEVL